MQFKVIPRTFIIKACLKNATALLKSLEQSTSKRTRLFPLRVYNWSPNRRQNYTCYTTRYCYTTRIKIYWKSVKYNIELHSALRLNLLRSTDTCKQAFTANTTVAVSLQYILKGYHYHHHHNQFNVRFSALPLVQRFPKTSPPWIHTPCLKGIIY
jgi:hypothetical protein